MATETAVRFQNERDLAENLGFKLFVKRATVGASKHLRVRPRFETWSVKGVFYVRLKELTFDVCQELFSLAGRFAGLCDWCPAAPRSPGPYGMFSATLKQIE